MSYDMMDYGARVHVGGKRTRTTKPETREQVIARNSFPGPDHNRHIDKFLSELRGGRASA